MNEPKKEGVNRNWSKWQKNCLAVFVFLSTASIIGGSAATGKSEDGRFFVGEHGRYTQVSRAMFTFSRVQTGFVFVMHVPALICLFAAGRGKTIAETWSVRFSRPNWLFISGLPLVWMLGFVFIRTASS